MTICAQFASGVPIRLSGLVGGEARPSGLLHSRAVSFDGPETPMAAAALLQGVVAAHQSQTQRSYPRHGSGVWIQALDHCRCA